MNRLRYWMLDWMIGWVERRGMLGQFPCRSYGGSLGDGRVRLCSKWRWHTDSHAFDPAPADVPTLTRMTGIAVSCPNCHKQTVLSRGFLYDPDGSDHTVLPSGTCGDFTA